MERRGGLARALWTGAKRSGRPDGVSTFMTLKGGLSRAIEALERSLPPGSVRADCPAQAVRRRGGHWEVATPRGPLQADAVVAALPAPALADAVESLDPELAARLREIPFVSTATSALVYDADRLPRLPKGFGFLAQRSENTTITAATFSTNKFPERAAAGAFTVRAFVGGAGREQDAEGPITRVEERIRREIEATLGWKGAVPRAIKTTRWLKANPQYDVGHARRLDRLASCLKGHPGLVLAGCSYGGVGLPDCVRSGKRAAELALEIRSRRDHDTVHAGLA
jgi:oxygen-dependent protoporphyrinogen oxidase